MYTYIYIYMYIYIHIYISLYVYMHIHTFGLDLPQGLDNEAPISDAISMLLVKIPPLGLTPLGLILLPLLNTYIYIYIHIVYIEYIMDIYI
jgi:hypothetical protein